MGRAGKANLASATMQRLSQGAPATRPGMLGQVRLGWTSATMQRLSQPTQGTSAARPGMIGQVRVELGKVRVEQLGKVRLVEVRFGQDRLDQLR